jgi:hypothetical protein
VTRAAERGLGEGQDVEELDVEPVGGQTRCLGDPVALLEDQDGSSPESSTMSSWSTAA